MKLEIFIVVPSYTSTGPVKGAIALANQLVTDNNVTLIFLKPGPGASIHIDSRVKILEIYHIATSILFKIKAYRNILKNLKGIKKPVSISMGFSGDFLNLFCTKLALTCSSVRGNLPVNYEMDYGLKGVLLAYFHLIMLRRFHIVIAMTKEMAEQVEKFIGRKPKIIGNFIDETNLLPYLSKKKHKNKQIKFIFVGSLSTRKCPLVLIDAVKLLRDNGQNLRLDILGNGELKDEILLKIRDYNLADIVKVHGHIEIPYELVRNASALVLPSMSEGISRAAMESLFLGTPVVMRDVDGNHTLVKDGFNGVLFKNNIDLPLAMMRATNLNSNSNEDNFLPNCYRQKSEVTKLLSLLEEAN